ncbi:kinase-like protein [Backusella circina FSU 941]|nr:kinase-like protein [Backusella circina FSU 941]
MSRLENQALRLSSLGLNEEKSIIIEKLTVDLCGTFKQRNCQFDYPIALNPKRVLTKPSAAVKNEGFDNENSDYILYVHDVLDERFEILEMLGSGTFGQVAKCKCRNTGHIKAVKIIKNKPAYLKQSTIEVNILKQLNTVFDPHDIYNILRMEDSFIHKNHLCLVFELLSVNLYELIKQNNFKGLSTSLVRVFATQILETLCILQEAKVIHCDLKPENILLRSLEVPSIKVIDFGSACLENQQTYSYIQSRFYRSPEVLLGLKYTTAIDMWSFGCIVAELFLGLPIFPGNSEYNQLTRITETMGDIPNHMILSGKYGHRYFNHSRKEDTYTLKDISQYSEERQKSEKPSKRYFSTFNLDRLVLKYPLPRKGMSLYEKEKEKDTRRELLDFLKKILQVDPMKRLTPRQAQQHPFILREEKGKVFSPLISPPLEKVMHEDDDTNSSGFSSDFELPLTHQNNLTHRSHRR